MRAFWSELVEGFRIAAVAVWASKLRALLTTLGIVIGIVSVTAMFTTINGIERGFERSMAMLGPNTLVIQRTPDTFGNDWWKYRSRPEIREELAYQIEQRRPRHVSAVAPIAYSGRIIEYGGERLNNVFIRASTPALADVSNLQLTEGRFFTDADQRSGRAVTVIGSTVAQSLFAYEQPVGKNIRIGGERYRVIGVMAEQGKFLGLFSFDDQVVVPISSFKRHFDADPYIEIQAKAASADQVQAAQDELTGIVRAARGLDPMEDDNFALQPSDAFAKQISGVKIGIYAVGLFLTSLSLLVGGIGVMNIMFVSVKERTREIGVRKALGATRRAILLQFLIEAVTVCLVGGAIGVGISFVVTELINRVFTAYLAPGTIALAFGICVGVGVVFGFVPAWSAARANPIDSLRYE